MGSDESHFNVLLTVRGKVTRQCLETTTLEERKELEWGIQMYVFATANIVVFCLFVCFVLQFCDCFGVS